MPTIGIDASRLHKPHKTGTEKYAESLITELLKLDTDAEWVLYTNNPIPQRILESNPKVRQVVHEQNRFWTINGLSKAIKKDKADILLNLATPQPFNCPIPSITVIHGMEFEHVPQNYSLGAFWHLVVSTWYTGRKSKVIVTPTEATRQDLVHMYDVPESKVKTIHSGLPTKIIDESSKVSETVKNILEKKYIFWVGRKEYRKNVDSLILAFDEFKKEYSFDDVQLVIAGSKGYGYKWVKKALKMSKHRNAIHNLEYVTEKEKDELYKHATLFVFPSLAEGFGFPILEAQSYQLPILSSDIDSLQEVGGEGISYVDPENIEEIVKEMKNLLLDETIAEKNAKAGQKNLKRFSFQIAAEEWYELILQNIS